MMEPAVATQSQTDLGRISERVANYVTQRLPLLSVHGPEGTVGSGGLMSSLPVSFLMKWG